MANLDSRDQRIGMMFVLTIFLSVPLFAVFMGLSASILGGDLKDWPAVRVPCAGLPPTNLAALSAY